MEPIHTSKTTIWSRKHPVVKNRYLKVRERVASCSVYILTGLMPIEAEIHKSQLILFGNIIRQDCVELVERDMALRQQAVKDLKGIEI